MKIKKIMLQRTLAIFGKLYIISEFENWIKREND